MASVVAFTAGLSGVSAQIYVPGDYASLQDALDASPAGGTIIVRGGIHPSIRIERAVTIVGEPMTTIRTTCCVPSTPHELPAIRLAGPGTGTVALQRIRTEGFVQDGVEATGGAGITGGGFQQLLVLHSEIAGSDGANPIGGAQIPGGPGIDVTVPYVVVSDSSVRGGSSKYPDFPGSPIVGTPGVRAPGSIVTLLDSDVVGGGMDITVFGPWSPCPPGCAAITGGGGGTGVTTHTLYRANSTVAGGAGTAFFCHTGFELQPLCVKPDGPALLVQDVVPLPGGFSIAGPANLGGDCVLTWTALGRPALILAAMGTQSPVMVPGRGFLFLDLTGAEIMVVESGLRVTDKIRVPSDSVLAGLVVTLQLFDPQAGLTRPLVVALLP